MDERRGWGWRGKNWGLNPSDTEQKFHNISFWPMRSIENWRRIHNRGRGSQQRGMSLNMYRTLHAFISRSTQTLSKVPHAFNCMQPLYNTAVLYVAVHVKTWDASADPKQKDSFCNNCGLIVEASDRNIDTARFRHRDSVFPLSFLHFYGINIVLLLQFG